METKCGSQKLDFLKHKIGYPNIFSVNLVRRKGGLVMFWQAEEDVEAINYYNHHIHLKVHYANFGKSWLITEFYGYPETNKRGAFWSLLSRINPSSEAPWCIIGNFNEILTQDDKKGDKRRPSKQMVDCRETLKNNGLMDIGWKGHK